MCGLDRGVQGCVFTVFKFLIISIDVPFSNKLSDVKMVATTLTLPAMLIEYHIMTLVAFQAKSRLFYPNRISFLATYIAN